MKRVMVKISGEALSGQGSHGFNPDSMNFIANELKELRNSDFEIAIVIGAGNFVRGKQLNYLNIHPATADYIGMLGTVMNALALAEYLNNMSIQTQALSMIDIPRLIKPYERTTALKIISQNILICAGGTGRPYFTTDTNSVQLAIELDCQKYLKATKVEGLYEDDPAKNPDTKFIKKTTFDEVISKNYKIMDATAFALCREHNLPIHIFDMKTRGNLLKAAKDENVGSIIH